MGQRPTSPSQGQPGALTRGGVRPRHRASGVATASGSGAMRRSEAKPERGKGRTYGVEGMMAKLTSGGAGKER